MLNLLGKIALGTLATYVVVKTVKVVSGALKTKSDKVASKPSQSEQKPEQKVHFFHYRDLMDKLAARSELKISEFDINEEGWGSAIIQGPGVPHLFVYISNDGRLFTVGKTWSLADDIRDITIEEGTCKSIDEAIDAYCGNVANFNIVNKTNSKFNN